MGILCIKCNFYGNKSTKEERGHSYIGVTFLYTIVIKLYYTKQILINYDNYNPQGNHKSIKYIVKESSRKLK